jgi:hypothetical protein
MFWLLLSEYIVHLYFRMFWLLDLIVNVVWHEIGSFFFLIKGSFLDMDDLDEIVDRRKELIIRSAALVGVISAWMIVRFRRFARARLSVTY